MSLQSSEKLGREKTEHSKDIASNVTGLGPSQNTVEKVSCANARRYRKVSAKKEKGFCLKGRKEGGRCQLCRV